ncbi:MAG: sporulation protein YqfD [Clostridia bacterium]|nr:sporulation protein YqfD [Clostridia bacterium]
MKSELWKNTVTVKVSQKNFESFVNECKKENIILRDIHSDGDGYVCNMTFGSFRRIRSAVSRSKVRVKIIGKTGTGYFIRLHRRRYGFFAGALLACLMLVYLTSCIWVIDVVGNDTTSEKEILEVMEDCGIGIGKPRFGKKISRIKNMALIELDTLSWLWVTLDGTRAVVEVREKGDSEDILDTAEPHNLVASYDGEIVDMQVRIGKKMVERGSIVSKGDLLVSGAVETVYKPNRYVHARGSVIARTWRSAEGEYTHIDAAKYKTGNVKKRYSIKIFGKELRLFFNKKIPYKDYILQTDEKPMKIFENIYLPFCFTTETFCEIIEKENTLEDEVVIERAVNQLTETIEGERHKDAVTLQRTYSYETLPNGNLYIIVTLESRENIAIPVSMTVETTEEYTSGENY